MGDDIPPGTLIGVLFLLLFLSAFFSGSETALMSLNRYRLRHKARQGHRGARLAEQLLKRPDRILGLILLGNNLVNILAASMVALIAMDYGGQPAVALASLIMTLVILIFAETAPKTWAALHPERLAYPAALIYYPLLKISYPLIWLINACSNAVLYLFGVRPGDGELQSLTRDELRIVVHEAGNRISSRYQQMLIGILDLEKVTVDDVMVPRNEIIGIDLDDDISDIELMIVNSQHTRLPVFRDSVDNIVGVLHLRRLANMTRQFLDKVQLEKLLDEPYFVPEGTPLSTQLVQFQRRRLRIAMVVDEYGDIQGIVTLEDILEEIVGDIDDEHDISVTGVRPRPDGSYLIDGGVTIRDLNREFEWKLPDEEASTIAGLVLYESRRIPEVGQRFLFHGFRFEIIQRHRHQITSLRVIPPTESS